MSGSSREKFTAGKNFLKEEKYDRALKSFEKAYKEDSGNPEYMSYFGLCKALRGGEIGLGLELCTMAIKKEYARSELYLNLGKVYMAAGNKKGAIKVFLRGLKFDPQNEEIHRRLNELGFRNRPVIKSLDRSNPVNKFLGIFFRRLLPRVTGKARKG